MGKRKKSQPRGPKGRFVKATRKRVPAPAVEIIPPFVRRRIHGRIVNRRLELPS